MVLTFRLNGGLTGHEFMRAKWPKPVRKYWKWSEKKMVKDADLVICDSVNIEKYIKEEYHHPHTTYIAYGADVEKSSITDDDPKFTGWLQEKGLKVGEYLERVLCAEAGGWQDQIAASFGGMNRIEFNKDGTYDVKPIIIHPDRKKQLNDNLLMFFTGFTRFSSEMQKANQAGYDEKVKQLQQMYALVDDAEKVLEDKHSDLDDFGRLLDTTWRLKRQTGGAITTNSIDALYENS